MSHRTPNIKVHDRRSKSTKEPTQLKRLWFESKFTRILANNKMYIDALTYTHRARSKNIEYAWICQITRVYKLRQKKNQYIKEFFGGVGLVVLRFISILWYRFLVCRELKLERKSHAYSRLKHHIKSHETTKKKHGKTNRTRCERCLGRR